MFHILATGTIRSHRVRGGGGGRDKCDITNYREITLGGHVGKFFCSDLNARLSEVMEQSILKEAQGGFRRNRRTTENHL